MAQAPNSNTDSNPKQNPRQAKVFKVNSEDLDILDDDSQYPEDYPDYFPSGIVEYLAKKDETNILSKREDTRGRLALVYTVATFGIFVLGFIAAIIDAAVTGNSVVENLMQLLPLISGIFLGTLGFVLGYYFRRAEAEENERQN